MSQTLDPEEIRKPVHAKTMGIEIECLLPRGLGRTGTLGNHHGFFFAGTDGSIQTSWSRGETGVEFVSQPLPFNWLCTELTRLSKRFPNWEWNDSCGIHVHVSRNWFNNKRVESLRDGLETLNPDQQELLFGRSFNGYCTRPTPHERTSRYCAINTRNLNTIEFRMFSGGDVNWAKECLRRTKLMVEFKGKPTFDNLLNLFTQPEKESK